MVVNLAVLISVPENEIQIYDVNALIRPDMSDGCLYSLERVRLEIRDTSEERRCLLT